MEEHERRKEARVRKEENGFAGVMKMGMGWVSTDNSFPPPHLRRHIKKARTRKSKRAPGDGQGEPKKTKSHDYQQSLHAPACDRQPSSSNRHIRPWPPHPSAVPD